MQANTVHYANRRRYRHLVATRDSFLLVPPSEGKTPGGTKDSKQGVFDDQLRASRKALASALRKELATITPARAAKLLKARGNLLDSSLTATKAALGSTPLTLPAWQRYSGVVWAHVDPASLRPRDRARLLIPSGLYGLNAATDEIAEYRLTMNVTLDGVGSLSSFWKEHLTHAIEAHCAKTTVVDLLPAEHRRSIDFEQLSETADVISVRFLTFDKKNAAGHGAKAVKGVLARAILVDGLDVVDHFSWEGWKATRTKNEISVRAPKP